MSFETLQATELVNRQRLEWFAIEGRHQQAFQRITEILYPHSEELAEMYITRFLANAGIKVDDATLQSQIGKTAEYSRQKFTPPIDSDWIRRVEKMGHLQHKLKTPPHANLAALNATHRKSAEFIFAGSADVEEGKYLVEQFLRVAALEAEILITTVQLLNQRDHERAMQEKADEFGDTINKLVTEAQDRGEKSREASAHASELASQVGVLINDQAAMTTQSTAAMTEAAQMAGKLEGATRSIDTALASAFEAFTELTDLANSASQVAATLDNRGNSIAAILAAIEDIASQAQILSLNALIEASRAGESGVGFSVVANEMRSLAVKTAEATREISTNLKDIRDGSATAASSNRKMLSEFETLRASAGQIRASIAEQSANVTSITACIDETAIGSESAAERMAHIAQRVDAMSTNAAMLAQDAGDLSQQLEKLEDRSRDFLASFMQR